MPRFSLTIFAALIATCGFSACAEAAIAPQFDQALLAKTVEAAAELPRLHALIVAKDGTPMSSASCAGRRLIGPSTSNPSPRPFCPRLSGIAIERGMLKNVNQPVLPLLTSRAPAPLDPESEPSRSIICSRCVQDSSGPQAGNITAAGSRARIG